MGKYVGEMRGGVNRSVSIGRKDAISIPQCGSRIFVVIFCPTLIYPTAGRRSPMGGVAWVTLRSCLPN